MNNIQDIEKKQDNLEEILRVSGSAALTRNEYGVTVINTEDTHTSLLYKSLQKDKFDEDEIKKAINVEIKELKPNIPLKRKDLVPKPLYDAEVQKVIDLTEIINALRQQISDLQNVILGLQAEVDNEKTNRLNIELTNDSLVNQLDALSDTVDDFGQQLSTAIQKSIEESIYRTSVQAQNDGFKAQIQALIKQIDSLNAIIEGLQAQLGALQQQKIIEDSAESIKNSEALGYIINNVVVAAVGVVQNSNIKSTKGYDLYAHFSANSGVQKWINGTSLKFNNTDKAPVEVTLKFTPSNHGGTWLLLQKTQFTLGAEQSDDIRLDLYRTSAMHALESHRRRVSGGYKSSKEYPGGSLLITVKRADGTTREPVSLACGFKKAHPDGY